MIYFIHPCPLDSGLDRWAIPSVDFGHAFLTFIGFDFQGVLDKLHKKAKMNYKSRPLFYLNLIYCFNWAQGFLSSAFVSCWNIGKLCSREI